MKTIPQKISVFQFLSAFLKILPRLPKMHYYLFKMFYASSREFNSWGVMIENGAKRFPDKAALKGNRELTYRELNEESNQVARALISHGVTAGEVVPVMLENCVEFPVVVSAIAKVGAVASLIPTSLKEESLERVLRFTPFETVVAGRSFSSSESSFLKENSGRTILWIGDSEVGPAVGIQLYDTLSGFSTENLPETRKVKSSDPYVYIFTSGTTGNGLKAAVIPHKRLLKSALWFGKIVQNSSPSDTVYSPLPFYHSSSLKMGWPAAVAGGSSFVLEGSFSVSHFFEQVKKWNVTMLIYVGEILTYLLQQPRSENDRRHSINKILGNGLRVEIWNQFRERFGITKLYEMYGASESPQTFSNILNLDHCVGVNLEPFTIVRIDSESEEIVRDANGFAEKVPAGGKGVLLIQVRDKRLFSGGYLNESDTEEKYVHSVKRMGDVWFNTGDIMQNLGFRHARFIDRIGDTYRWKGENGSTREVESIMYRIPGIQEAIAYGVKVPNYDGRAGMVTVVSDDSDALSGILEKAFASALPSQLIPRFLRVSDLIDTTDSFKTKKRTFQFEGADPAVISDKISVWSVGESKYIPLTPELYNDIKTGRFRI